MSVTLVKPGDDTPRTQPAPVYITIAQLPDGRVDSVTVDTTAPDRAELFTSELRGTVWATPVPTDGTHGYADPVLSLTLSPDYRDAAPTVWADGERAAHAFNNDRTDERAFLRNVEARIIRLGFTNAHTGMTACQTYGLTFAGTDEHYAYRSPQGWTFATEDYIDCDGRYEQPRPIAPTDASARRVAAAIVAQLLDLDEIDPAQLPPLRRAYARYLLWRITPTWANFRYRTRLRLDRLRYRITKRVTARTR